MRSARGVRMLLSIGAMQARFCVLGQEREGVAEAEVDGRGHQVDLEGAEGPLDRLLGGAGELEDFRLRIDRPI